MCGSRKRIDYVSDIHRKNKHQNGLLGLKRLPVDKNPVSAPARSNVPMRITNIMTEIITVTRSESYIIRGLQEQYPRSITAKELSRLVYGFTTRELIWILENKLKQYVDSESINTTDNRAGLRSYTIKPEYRFCGFNGDDDDIA